MKKPKPQKNKKQNKSKPDVSANVSKPSLMKIIVKELSGLAGSNENAMLPMARGWASFDTSSPEAYVNGTIVFSYSGENFRVPFNTSFLFTCLKSSRAYKIAWSMSLS